MFGRRWGGEDLTVIRASVLHTVVLVAAGVTTSCGTTTNPVPEPSESWYVFAVQCANCPGLTNVEIDRSSTPYRARLRVGQQTSLRATARDGCGSPELQFVISRWQVSDPKVVSAVPSSPESAIVTALAPGTARLTATRMLPSGGSTSGVLKDVSATSGCAVLPELLIWVLP